MLKAHLFVLTKCKYVVSGETPLHGILPGLKPTSEPLRAMARVRKLEKKNHHSTVAVLQRRLEMEERLSTWRGCTKPCACTNRSIKAHLQKIKPACSVWNTGRCETLLQVAKRSPLRSPRTAETKDVMRFKLQEEMAQQAIKSPLRADNTSQASNQH